MAESEQAQKFQNPPRTFPKKEKKVVDFDEGSKKNKMYGDKNASEHDKAVTSLGLLFSYYNDRYHPSTFEKPDVRKRVALSVRMEKKKRIAKNYFLVPKTFEQIESYVNRLFQNGVLKVDESANIQRKLVIKQTEMMLKTLNNEPFNLMMNLVELYLLKKIKYLQESNPLNNLPQSRVGNFNLMK